MNAAALPKVATLSANTGENNNAGIITFLSNSDDNCLSSAGETNDYHLLL
jgi:hypothetical protein